MTEASEADAQPDAQSASRAEPHPDGGEPGTPAQAAPSRAGAEPPRAGAEPYPAWVPLAVRANGLRKAGSAASKGHASAIFGLTKLDAAVSGQELLVIVTSGQLWKHTQSADRVLERGADGLLALLDRKGISVPKPFRVVLSCEV